MSRVAPKRAAQKRCFPASTPDRELQKSRAGNLLYCPGCGDKFGKARLVIYHRKECKGFSFMIERAKLLEEVNLRLEEERASAQEGASAMEVSAAPTSPASPPAASAAAAELEAPVQPHEGTSSVPAHAEPRWSEVIHSDAFGSIASNELDADAELDQWQAHDEEFDEDADSDSDDEDGAEDESGEEDEPDDWEKVDDFADLEGEELEEELARASVEDADDEDGVTCDPAPVLRRWRHSSPTRHALVARLEAEAG